MQELRAQRSMLVMKDAVLCALI